MSKLHGGAGSAMYPAAALMMCTSSTAALIVVLTVINLLISLLLHGCLRVRLLDHLFLVARIRGAALIASPCLLLLHCLRKLLLLVLAVVRGPFVHRLHIVKQHSRVASLCGHSWVIGGHTVADMGLRVVHDVSASPRRLLLDVAAGGVVP